MHPTDLFTTLHARFNTRTCPIQDPGAFLVDVRECIDESPDIETFYAKMDKRRDERVRELEGAWSNVASLMMSLISSEPICGDPNCKSLETESKLPRTAKNDIRWNRAASFAHMSRTMSFDNMLDFFEGFVRDMRERERRKKELREQRRRERRAAQRNKTLLDDVASTVSAQAPPTTGDCSPLLQPPLPPVSPSGDGVDEVTATTQKCPDQSNVGEPTPALTANATAKTAASSWQPRPPSPLSALSPSPPCKERKTDEEEPCSEGFAVGAASPVSRKRRRGTTGLGTDGGDDDGTASGYRNTSRKCARVAEGGLPPEDGQPHDGKQ